MPEELVVAAVTWIGETVGGEIGATLIMYSAEAAAAIEVAATVASIWNVRDQQRKALNSQKDAYNASLRDRYVMVRGATEPRQMVLGRQRVSGTMAYIGSYGTNREHLVFALPIAAHEIDAIEEIYFDDERVSLDGSGNVLAVNRREQFTITSASDTFTLQGPPVAGSVSAVAKYGTTSVTLTVGTITGNSVPVSGAHSAETGTVTITYHPNPSPYLPSTGAYETFIENVVTGTPSNGSVQLDGSGNATLVLSKTPSAGSVNAVLPSFTNGEDVYLNSYMTVTGSTVTITGAPYPSAWVFVSYGASPVSNYKARIRKYLGAPGQTADAGMISALPGVWTSNHIGVGLAYLVCEFDYDPDAFPSGVPNVSALVRGAKVYDPRAGLTAWSENNALLMRYAATSSLCGRLDSTLVNDTSISAAANVCDTSAAYLVNGQTYTRAKYTAGLVVKSGVRAQDVLNDLSQAMVGRWTFIDGLLRVKAGGYVTPLQTLDDSWLHGAAPIQIQPRANRQDVFNVATGKFADEQTDYQVLDFPRVASTPYITEDGADLPLDIQLNAVTFSGQAQQVVATMMRDARQGLRLTVLCNMRAYPVEVFDNLYVTLSRYGWVTKPFEVVDVTWTLDGGIQLTMKETDSTIWDMGTSFAASDPAPNTLLPSPFIVPAIAGLACASGTAQLKRQADGTIVSRISATWTAVTDEGVLSNGGGVEIRYGLASQPEDQWMSVLAPATQSQAYINDVRDTAIYLVKARAYNPLVKGKWSPPVLHKVVGKTSAPAAVAGLTATAIPGFIRLTWTAGTEIDEAGVDLGRGASWGAATGLEGQTAKSFAAGVGVNSYDWAWPAAGSYTVRAKRRDTSGNPSSETTLSVTVTAAGIAIGTAQIAASAVGTTELAADSATEAFQATVAGPVGVGITTANTAGTSIATQTYGGYAFNCTIIIHATFTATVTPTATIAFQIAAWIDSGMSSVSPSYVSAQVPGGSAATDHSMSISYQFAYTAGSGSKTATLLANGGWPAGTLPAPSGSIKDVSLRVEVIKR